jgi:hypothetical protein
MVLLIRSIGRLASSSSPSSRSLFTAAAQAATRRSAFPGAAAPATTMALRNGFGSIRRLTGKREKVKVLLVLYDGMQHAKDVSLSLLSSLANFNAILLGELVYIVLCMLIATFCVILGPGTPRHDRERARYPEVARGSGTYAGHHFGQGGRELYLRQGAG